MSKLTGFRPSVHFAALCPWLWWQGVMEERRKPES